MRSPLSSKVSAPLNQGELRALTGAVRGLAVGGLQTDPLAVPSSVGGRGLGAAPRPALLTQAPAGQGAGAPGAPGGQTPVLGAVGQGAVPQAVLTGAEGRDSETPGVNVRDNARRGVHYQK